MPTREDTIEDLAQRLRRAHATGERARVDPDLAPSYAEALDLQRRVLPELGEVSGFKVGALLPGQPAMAPIPAARTFGNGAEVPARGATGIELEIGFEVIAPPAAGLHDSPQAYFRPRIVLELCDQRLEGDALDPLLKLADMQLNDGLVVGSALPDWDGRDFGEVEARLTCGATTVIDGPVEVPGGSALGNLWTLLDHLGPHCGGIAVGHIIITGSVSGLTWFPPGTDIEARIAGFAPLTCRIVGGR